MHTTPTNLDILPAVVLLVRKSIEMGLVPDETPESFDKKVDEMEGNTLEDYLQNLWDAA